MNETSYRSVCAYADLWLAEERPWAEPIGRAMQGCERNAVYIVCDWSGCVLYVGSVSRGEGAARQRMIEHLRDTDRTLRWSTVWTIPLRNEIPLSRLRRIEGLVGRHLCPTESKSLPSLKASLTGRSSD